VPGGAIGHNGGVSLTPSGGPPDPRLSDDDRERVVEVLKVACSHGRVTLDEFSERVEAAFRAVGLQDLSSVLADLPHPFGPDLSGVLVAGSSAAAATPVPVPPTVPDTRAGRPVTRWTVSVMGGSQRKGRWRLREKTNAVAVMGGCLLDMRNAEVEGPGIVIKAVAVMGGIEIVVPEGIEVELSGIAVMGGKDARRVKDTPALPGAPLIQVKAFAFWGSVTVRSKPARASKGRDVLDAGTGAASLAAAVPDAGGETRGPRLIDVVADGANGVVDSVGTQNLPEGTVTIMFSDIEGFTSITEQLGDRRAMEILREHNGIIRQQIARCAGHEIKAQGDGFMVAFGGASRALQCAVGIQSDFAARNRSEPEPAVHVRLGLHAGEAIRDGNDFLGGAVILAARIAQQARGGEILVSSVLKELCDLGGEFQFENGREVQLKGLTEPRRVYSVIDAGAGGHGTG
jgi:class 3 adenylate cyclase